jgi:hypothetical protein
MKERRAGTNKERPTRAFCPLAGQHTLESAWCCMMMCECRGSVALAIHRTRSRNLTLAVSLGKVHHGVRSPENQNHDI